MLVSMVPSVACAIRVSSELPEAWLNSQAYQKVTAIVASVSTGLDPNWGHQGERDIPDGDTDRHDASGGQRCPGGLQFRLSPAAEAGFLRKLGV